MHTCMHKYIHTYKQTYIHTNKHTYIHTYIHKYIHTHIHTYIHTYIHIHAYSQDRHMGVRIHARGVCDATRRHDDTIYDAQWRFSRGVVFDTLCMLNDTLCVLRYTSSVVKYAWCILNGTLCVLRYTLCMFRLPRPGKPRSPHLPRGIPRRRGVGQTRKRVCCDDVRARARNLFFRAWSLTMLHAGRILKATTG